MQLEGKNKLSTGANFIKLLHPLNLQAGPFLLGASTRKNSLKSSKTSLIILIKDFQQCFLRSFSTCICNYKGAVS